MRKLVPFLSVLTIVFAQAALAAVDPDQSAVHPPSGDGWQVLGTQSSPVISASAALAGAPPIVAVAGAAPSTSTEVKAVVLPGAAGGEPTGTLSLSITPQDMNLRNALDRWLSTQGWQLAWKIDDDLPVEFNASFSGDFDSVLTQVMQATNHMRTPARICEHTNNVIRVIARAANCQD
ncbi:toxin co-regulated pilus biosynthesis Q family protein [Paraburkholderia acidisoli]